MKQSQPDGGASRDSSASAAESAAMEAIELLPVAYNEIDAQGVIVRANRAALAMHPPEVGEIVGRSIWDLLPADEREISREAFMAVIESGEEPTAIKRSIYAGNGQYRTYEMHRNLIRDGQGRTVGLRYVNIDVTEAQRAQERTYRVRQWLESVLESMPEAMVITDALGFIRSVNPATEALFGWKASALTGKAIEKALPLLKISGESETRLSFNMALRGRSSGVATMLDSERREMRVQISSSPIVDKTTGFTTGVVSVMRRVEAAE